MNSSLLIRVLILALGIAAVSFCTGCATIVKGTTQEIPVSSEPTGARVSVDGSAAGTTPTTVTLSRKANHMVTIEKEGFQSESVAITKSMSAAVAGNIIAGGLVGWGVDAVSGAQYNLNPTTVNVRLQPVATARSGDNGNGGNADTIDSPATAKNVVTVGALEQYRNITNEVTLLDGTTNNPIWQGRTDSSSEVASYSSRGNVGVQTEGTYGRFKPDVVAPGTWIASLRSVFANDDNAWSPISANYLYQGGTSQAGPHVSGAAAVFVQYWRQTHTNATPSPALVKAALINSARSKLLDALYVLYL